MACVHGGYPIGKYSRDQNINPRGYKMNGQARRIITHSRNIRAVMFHPNGDYVFVAAPDPPRIPSAKFTPCRLYAFSFNLVFDLSLPEHIDLQTLPTIVPQIHLYSDGGFDISQDGQNLFTCAMLHVPPIPITKPFDKQLNNRGSFSPLSHRERSVADDEHDNAHANDSILQFLQDSGRPRSQPDSRPISRTKQRRSNNNQIQQISENNNNNNIEENTILMNNNDDILPPPPMDNNMNYIRKEISDYNNSNENSNPMKFPQLMTPPGDDIEMTRNDNNDDQFDFDFEDFEEELKPIFADKRHTYGVPEGWKLEEHVCLFNLTFQENGVINKVNLIRYRPLTGALMKAVTSAKLSPTGRYALIGYGVRNRGVVEDHPHSLVACEVIDIMEKDIKTVSIMADSDDEVNIAQFHPTPGSGILYGTKKGKVRVFQRWQNS